MQPQNVRIVMTDLDGTFIHNIFEPVKENLVALHRLQMLGVPVVPVTARNYDCIRKLIKHAGFSDYAITNNGSSIQDIKTGENIWENPIPDVFLSAALALCAEAGAIVDVHDSYHALHLGPNVPKGYLEMENDMEADPDLKTFTLTLDTIDDIVKFMNGHAQLIRVIFRQKDMPHWLLEKLVMAGDFQLTTSHQGLIEIMASGSGKRCGVEKLAQLLSIDRQSVMACGDQFNDIGMLKWAGVGVAMGNAKQGVKQAADYVTGPYEKGGVAQAIEKFVLNLA